MRLGLRRARAVDARSDFVPCRTPMGSRRLRHSPVPVDLRHTSYQLVTSFELTAARRAPLAHPAAARASRARPGRRAAQHALSAPSAVIGMPRSPLPPERTGVRRVEPAPPSTAAELCRATGPARAPWQQQHAGRHDRIHCGEGADRCVLVVQLERDLALSAHLSDLRQRSTYAQLPPHVVAGARPAMRKHAHDLDVHGCQTVD